MKNCNVKSYRVVNTYHNNLKTPTQLDNHNVHTDLLRFLSLFFIPLLNSVAPWVIQTDNRGYVSKSLDFALEKLRLSQSSIKTSGDTSYLSD